MELKTLKKPGFTLAEVLITLGIIGVVAAMTIPSLMNKTSDAELKTGLKKSFSVLNQAALSSSEENGGLKSLCTDSNCMMAAFLPYLKYTKKCTPNAQPGCWHNDYAAKWLHNNTIYWSGTNPAVINNDGSIFFFRNGVADCAAYTYTCSPEKDYSGYEVLTDVNGFKNPNIVGKDIFYFHILNDRVIPFPDNDCISTNKGVGCASVYLYK